MSRHALMVALVGLGVVSAAGVSLSAGLAASRVRLRRRLGDLAVACGEHDRGSLHELVRRLQRAAARTVTSTHDRPTPPADPPFADPHFADPHFADRHSADLQPISETHAADPRPAGAADPCVPAFGSDSPSVLQILEALPQGVVMSVPGTARKFRNARAAILLEGQSELLAARAVDDLLERSADGAPAERTIELYGPPRRTLTVRTVPIRGPGGSLSVLAVIEDISELRRLEAVRSDFVANMSHELKTPAGALGLLAETLADEEDPRIARHLADRIQAEAFRLTRIIDDLLDLSRIEASDAPPRAAVELEAVLAEALDGLRTMAQARAVGLVLTESRQPLVVLGDRRQLVSALHNLLANAVKFTDGGTDVTLSATATPDGASVDVVVADHGMGIPTADLERVFERFYRVDHGRGRDSGGTGLGLAIVRHVANNHGGRVWVDSREGEGSVFTLRLPLASAAQPVELSEL